MCQLNSKPENLENPMEQYTSTLHNISEKNYSENLYESKKTQQTLVVRRMPKWPSY